MKPENPRSERLIRHVNRQQLSWRAIDVERLIDDDHVARAIWCLVGGLDLQRFYEGIESSAETGGRPAFDPQMLISVWIYAYAKGIGSAREVARRCEFDPAFQWLTGLQEVNYHTLADFRVNKEQELDDLFTQVLAALSKEGLITLHQVMQDGTKIQALASSRSFHKEQAIREHLERARRRVMEMGEPQDEEQSPKMRQARARAICERQQRLESALGELEKLRDRTSRRAKNRGRVSISEPESRIMRHGDDGRSLSYNAQISTDAAEGLIVGATVTQAVNDWGQLPPAVKRLQERLGKTPGQMIADAGYTSRETIAIMAERQIDFVGSMPRRDATTGRTTPGRLPPSAFLYQPETNRYVCPGGKWLRPQGCFNHKRSGITVRRYEAAASDCNTCALRSQCCPNNRRGRGLMRVQESAAVVAFRQKMATPEAQAQYRRRSRVSEFCHAWIKSKLGLRRFHVRGLAKAGTELLWACLTYNLQHWIRLRKAVAQIA